MTKIKFCGLTRKEDILAVNRIRPDYIGFVFAKKSKRAVSFAKARELKEMLDPGISAVGVFVDEAPEQIAALLRDGIIDIAQLHGGEDNEYVRQLQYITDRPVIKAYQIHTPEDIQAAKCSPADYILLDSGSGSGVPLDWNQITGLDRPYFLAGGLTTDNVSDALHILQPYAADVSSGIETDGKKDIVKMQMFADIVRGNQT